MEMRLLGIAVAICVGFGHAQTGTTARPEFEVASIKPSKPGTPGMSVQANSGRLTASNASLQVLISMAYQVKNYQLSGVPSWLNSEKFDITAKAPPDADNSFDQSMAMLQTLLADRFKLAIHRETKLVQGYALVVAKPGSKLHESTVEEESGIEKPLFTGRRGNITAERITIDQLADTLAREVGGPVSDMTGIQGVFQLHLEWTPEGRQPMKKPVEGAERPTSTTGAEGPSIFTALQEQLGLKLDARKVPAGIIVIDHVEKMPSEN